MSLNVGRPFMLLNVTWAPDNREVRDWSRLKARKSPGTGATGLNWPGLEAGTADISARDCLADQLKLGECLAALR